MDNLLRFPKSYISHALPFWFSRKEKKRYPGLRKCKYTCMSFIYTFTYSFIWSSIRWSFVNPQHLPEHVTFFTRWLSAPNSPFVLFNKWCNIHAATSFSLCYLFISVLSTFLRIPLYASRVSSTLCVCNNWIALYLSTFLYLNEYLYHCLLDCYCYFIFYVFSSHLSFEHKSYIISFPWI